MTSDYKRGIYLKMSKNVDSKQSDKEITIQPFLDVEANQ